MTISGGVPIERHLCESCARDAGLVSQGPVPLQEILEQIAPAVGAAAAPQAPAKRTDACPACATTFAEFKQTGRLGCPECYKAFAPQLGPILDRAHGGATHHVGKVPRRAAQGIGDPSDVAQREIALARSEARAEEIRHLRVELEQAIRTEKYEDAATLRDRIRRLQRGSETAQQSPGDEG